MVGGLGRNSKGWKLSSASGTLLSVKIATAILYSPQKNRTHEQTLKNSKSHDNNQMLFFTGLIQYFSTDFSRLEKMSSSKRVDCLTGELMTGLCPSDLLLHEGPLSNVMENLIMGGKQ